MSTLTYLSSCPSILLPFPFNATSHPPLATSSPFLSHPITLPYHLPLLSLSPLLPQHSRNFTSHSTSLTPSDSPSSFASFYARASFSTFISTSIFAVTFVRWGTRASSSE